MRRINDYYNWKRLEHWKHVIDCGSVAIDEDNISNINEKVFDNAIKLLKENCFPVAIVCCEKKEGQKKILSGTIWDNIFSFLNNRKALIRGSQEIYYLDLGEEEQSKILNAEIFSIWVIEE